MTLKCLIVDDEPLALDLLSEYIDKLEYLEVISKCNNVYSALNILLNEDVDLLFLDIQMPELTGFDLVDSLKTKPHIIFTTAYQEYALRSYDYDAIDYLLKPISFSRFYKAVNKLIGRMPQLVINKNNLKDDVSFIFLNINGQSIKVNLDKIIYIRGWSNYIIVLTETTKYVVRDNMKHISELLINYGFIRVHKSFIVPLNRITKIEGNFLVINNENIPVGKFYKEKFIQEIDKIRIG